MRSSLRLPLAGAALAALVAAGCSGTTPAAPAPTTPTTPGTGTVTPAVCTFSLSSTRVTATPAGGASTITVTAGTGCTWTAASSASFVTITSGASGSGNGSVVLGIAVDSGADRTGTLTIAGQTVTVTQTGAGIIAAFEMTDPASQIGATSVCRVRGGPGNPVTNCPLASTSRPTGTSFLVNWAWTVRYTYDGVAKTRTQSSETIRDLAFFEYCGLNPSSAAGTSIPLSVSLTVTDNNGIQATATSGSGNQPAMQLIAFTCS